ncbi:hypothetical protein ACJRO7_021949 [Eucalyptus globulus]|uniref:Uncharacterized protein n=1 Tax=Eucalyptus globulus TaxID=34317 RepID=A0ABD3KP04_EUCGL
MAIGSIPCFEFSSYLHLDDACRCSRGKTEFLSLSISRADELVSFLTRCVTPAALLFPGFAFSGDGSSRVSRFIGFWILGFRLFDWFCCERCVSLRRGEQSKGVVDERGELGGADAIGSMLFLDANDPAALLFPSRIRVFG